MSDKSRQHHDMGGTAAGAVNPSDHPLDDWEKQVEAMVFLLTGFKHKTFRADELRREIEAMAPDDYDEAGYFGRWIAAMCEVLIDKGVLDRTELDARLAPRESP